MAERFIAQNPGDQKPETYRQFVELQSYLTRLEERGRPSAVLVAIDDITLTDAWQELQETNPSPPLAPGFYMMSFVAIATGSTANAEAQFRVGVFEGGIISVGNQRLTVTGMLAVPEGVSPVLEARGVSCALSSVSTTVFRVGFAT